tara:strand:+ start:13368 stop:14615 length:1248 start_codon:yes stop_codon:yes gene_type:complete
MIRKKKGNYLLVFDSAYNSVFLRDRNLEVFVTSKDLDGYFDHVWTVNPFATVELDKSDEARFGKIKCVKLSERHTILECRMGLHKSLRFFPPLNFALAQMNLVLSVYGLMRRYSIKFVRAEDPLINGFYGMLFSKLFRLPLLIGVWGNPDAIRKQTKKPLMPRAFLFLWVEEIWERMILKFAKIVMVQNHDNQKFVLDKGVHESRIVKFTLDNAVHESHFLEPSERPSAIADLEEYGITSEKIVLCLSRLVASKRVDQAVLAISEESLREIDLRLLMVGDGSDREELKELAKNLGVENKVVFTGNKDQKWIARVIPKVDAVLAPLAGRALLEVALGAAPVVAYDIDWHKDLIETGKSGELVEHLDHVAMANSLKLILENRDYSQKIGRELRVRALSFANLKTTKQKQIDVYESLF